MSIYNELWGKENFFPRYNKRGNFNTNAESYYKYLERVNEVLKIMAKMLDEQDEKLDDGLQEIRDTLQDYINQLEIILAGVDDYVVDKMVEWLNDGTLEHIINHEIFNDKLDKTIFEQMVVNVMHPPAPLKPAKGNGVDDDVSAIQAIIDFVHSKGGGTVFLPTGEFKISTNLNPKSGVSIKGVGMGKSIIMNHGKTGAITWHVGLDSSLNPDINADNPFLDMHYSDFTVDCSNSPNEQYSVSNKGIYIQYMRRCSVIGVEIKNSVATGLGIDFLDQTVIDGNVVENCGRGFISPTTTIGASGIGIGNGGLEKENVVITNNIVRNAGQYGIFIEDQKEFGHTPHFEPEGTVIANNVVSGGRNAGIGVKRGGGVVVDSNYVYGNTGNGIEVINGSKKVSLTNNVSYNNGGKDVFVQEHTQVNTQSQTETFADYNASTPLEDFPFGETVSIVGSANRVGTPNGLAGILKTVKPTVYVSYATQYFRESALTPNERLYFRVGVAVTPTTGNWGNWTQIGGSSPYVIAISDAYNAETTPTTFPDKQITENLITGVNTTGTPNGLAGVLITDKSSGQISVANQIFKEKDTPDNKSPRLYYRNTKADTMNWGQWTRVITSNDTERISIPNTTGNTIEQLEGEVNKLKNLLRGLGMLS